MSALPKFTMKDLLDAGVHFGHKTMRWNPRMAPYIYGERNNIHIIDLQKTVPLLHRALETARDVAASNGRILFVSTKRQAAPVVAEAAKRCGQYYVNHRWLGGMLTNWGTVSQSIKALRQLEEQLNDAEANFSKKERLNMERKIIKLDLTLGGIKDMGGLPNLIFVIDTNKEDIAVMEANKLGIPVIAIVDSNSNPDNIDHIIPGNDDALRAIQLYCDLVSDAVLKGIEAAVGRGKDAGASIGSPADLAAAAKEMKEPRGGKGKPQPVKKELKVEEKTKKKTTSRPKTDEASSESEGGDEDAPKQAAAS